MKINNVLFVGKSKKKTGNTKFMLNALKRRVKKVTFINVPRCRKLYFWTDYEKIIHKKINNINPDLVLSYSKDIPFSVLENIRKEYKTAIFYPDVTIPIDEQLVSYARKADYLFITNNAQLDDLSSMGVAKPVFCMQGCDHSEHRIISTKKSRWLSDVAFVGRPSNENRINLIRAVDNSFYFKAWGGHWEKYGLACLKNHIYPKEYAMICYASKIVLGCDYYNHMKKYFSNRTWITMGCGGFLLTNYVPGLETIFKKGVHLEWYNSHQECLDLIGYYLKHGEKRKKIAQNGYEFVHSTRTYDVVMNEIITHIENRENNGVGSNFGH
ncbi:MAG TPA: hypothetical protein DD405_05020 [Desulfobacteraceae bacterium]|nr:hypothetical protein [Desulfobacteraceae bacterium]